MLFCLCDIDMNPIVLTISTGRCGTTFLDRTFKSNFSNKKNWISHEYLRQNITNVGLYHRCYSSELQDEMANKEIKELIENWTEVSRTGPVVDFGWTMRSLVPYLYDEIGTQLKVLYIHRHPIAVAASFKLIGSYSIYNSPEWTITPSHPRALYPEFEKRWSAMTAFEKCLYLWLEVNAYALEIKEKYPKIEFLEVKSEALFTSNVALEDIARFTEFYKEGQDIKPSIDKNPRDQFSLERRPIKNEWLNYERHPEVISFAKELGYNMDKNEIAKFIHKYQLPKGMLPFIRNKSGYWQHKENLGKLLRRFGLRK